MTGSDVISEGKVALVTGAASGIGKAACKVFAEKGMRVCLVDLPGTDLDTAFEEVAALAPGGKQAVLKFPADISEAGAIDALHRRLLSGFGKVNLLMNNAVTRTGRDFAADMADWRQAMEINFWAVVQAVRRFLPDMCAVNEASAIVNVGSKQGITNPPGHPIYNITKSALKSYTEALEHELRTMPDNQGSQRLRAHLLIPGWTTTGGKAHQPGAWLPEQVVSYLCRGLARGDFYILCPDDEVTTEMDHKRILWAARDITENRPPLSRWHPDYADRAKRECS